MAFLRVWLRISQAGQALATVSMSPSAGGIRSAGICVLCSCLGQPVELEQTNVLGGIAG